MEVFKREEIEENMKGVYAVDVNLMYEKGKPFIRTKTIKVNYTKDYNYKFNWLKFKFEKEYFWDESVWNPYDEQIDEYLLEVDFEKVIHQILYNLKCFGLTLSNPICNKDTELFNCKIKDIKEALSKL